MHISSHISAFQAQWIIKYLDPRDSPWKDVLDHWILRDDELGRGTLLSSDQEDFSDRLPQRSHHMRSCLQAFASLRLTQDLSILTHESQGEPLWKNNRFTPTLPHATREIWVQADLAPRLSELLNDDNDFSSVDQWQKWISDYAPTDLHGNARDDWIDDRELDLGAIASDIPRRVKRAIIHLPTFEDGQIVHVERPNGEPYYARLQLRTGRQDLLHVLFLDISGFPHVTGRKIRLTPATKLTHVALWKALNKHYQSPLSGDVAPPERDRTAIIGPTTTAFPLNEGWHLESQHPRTDGKDDGPPRCLSDLTIHEMCLTLTKAITKDVRPSCESNWPAKWPRAFLPPFSAIWPTITTPLCRSMKWAWRRHHEV